MSTNFAPAAAPRPRHDLMNVPHLGGVLRWRHARTAAQAVTFSVAVLIVYDGLFGPQLAPKNLAGVLPWVHWRGLIVLALLLVGNAFCFACPFMLPRGIAKRVFTADRAWPARWRGKWLAVGLLALFFWGNEAFDLWASPWMTAWLALAYFAAALAVDAVFRGAAFCKYLCPIGQFHFVNSVASPFTVKTRDQGVCHGCAGKECIAGRGERGGRAKGCELWLFQGGKEGNFDCTFCLDCVHACPHDNVGILPRLPGSELWHDRSRSGVGRLSARPDLAALSVVLVAAAFVNALGMVAPVSELERLIDDLLPTDSAPATLFVIFAVGLFVLPALLVGSAAVLGRALSGSKAALARVATRYAYSLIPLGFGMWLGHYSFHLMTGALTIVPVAHSFLADLGLPLVGAPRWGMAAIVPGAWLLPIEITLLEGGLLATLLSAYRIALAEERDVAAARHAFVPWAALAFLLFSAGVWLLLQPMEMRGTFG